MRISKLSSAVVFPFVFASVACFAQAPTVFADWAEWIKAVHDAGITPDSCIRTFEHPATRLYACFLDNTTFHWRLECAV